MRVRWLGRVCAVAVWFVVCTGASEAQERADARVVVLAPGLDAERAAREQVRAGLMRIGVEILDVRDAADGDILAACRAVECAPRVMASVGASFAVLVVLTDGALRMTLVAADGTAREVTSALVAPIDTEAATAEAFERARLSFNLGTDGRIYVRSVPPGALVAIDGAPSGLAPMHVRVKPGTYRVTSTMEGFAPAERVVTVASGQVETLTVGLTRATDTQVSTTAPVLDYVLGSVLVIGALPALSISLDTLAREGQCDGRRDPQGRCSDTVYFGTQSAVLLSVGALALGAGLYSFFATPFTADVELSTETARAVVSGVF
jgi:PEGA domain